MCPFWFIGVNLWCYHLNHGGHWSEVYFLIAKLTDKNVFIWRIYNSPSCFSKKKSYQLLKIMGRTLVNCVRKIYALDYINIHNIEGLCSWHHAKYRILPLEVELDFEKIKFHQFSYFLCFKKFWKNTDIHGGRTHMCVNFQVKIHWNEGYAKKDKSGDF